MKQRRIAARLKATALNGEYSCTSAREQNKEIPGASGRLILRAMSVSTGVYELMFSCRGSREIEKGSFALKGNLMELKIIESNYSTGPVEGAKIRVKLQGDRLIMVYFEPETGVNLLSQVWQKIK